MRKQLDQLIKWNETFGVPYNLQPLPTLDRKSTLFRATIMRDEVDEWEEAAEHNHSIEHRAKELADILFTVFGTITTEGLQDHIERVFDAVYESNMSKVGEDGKPILRADGKVLKGPNYKEPDLSFLV